MRMKSSSSFENLLRRAIFGVTAIFLVSHAAAQTGQAPPQYPSRLPYAFSNFVWWSDDALRTLLKERISGLGDEIAPNRVDEGKVRDALTAILKSKGIVAEIQSVEPSNFSLSAERALGSPQPAIVFSIESPKIMVDQVVLSPNPSAREDLAPLLGVSFHRSEGHPYASGQDWLLRTNAQRDLAQKGYLDVKIDIKHGDPRKSGDRFLVNLEVSIDPGPQYRISSITGDGGPLLQGRDLSSHFTASAGQVAAGDPFARLSAELRALYAHSGYADVALHTVPELDHEHALVAYRLDLVPGPVYHLRTLTVHNLSAEQEAEVRPLLGIRPGDVYDEMAVTGLYQKVAADPLLAGYNFSFKPARDKSSAQLDLTLDFFKSSIKSSVTVH